MLRLSYDQEADALYLKLQTGRLVARTIEIDPGTMVDVDETGELTGIEVIRPARDWPLDEIIDRFGIDEGTAAVLRQLAASRPNQNSTLATV